MAQAFFHASEDGLVVAGLKVNDTIGSETGLFYRWSKKVWTGNAPEHLPLCARRDSRAEESGGRAVDGSVATACYFVQRAEREAAPWQTRVELAQAKRKNR